MSDAGLGSLEEFSDVDRQIWGVAAALGVWLAVEFEEEDGEGVVLMQGVGLFLSGLSTSSTGEERFWPYKQGQGNCDDPLQHALAVMTTAIVNCIMGSIETIHYWPLKIKVVTLNLYRLKS